MVLKQIFVIVLLISLSLSQTSTTTPLVTISPSATITPFFTIPPSATPTPSRTPSLFTPSPSISSSRFVSTPTAASIGPYIEIDYPGLNPISVAQTDLTGLLVSSATLGTVFAVNTDGSVKAAFQSNTTQHTFGLCVDKARNRIWVANNQIYPGVNHNGNVFPFDLSSGQQLFEGFIANVGGFLPLLLNQVTVDPDGNAYATDSYSGRVFRIDGEDGTVSLLSNETFFLPQNGNPIGLTGVASWNNDFIIVAVYADAENTQLYKIPLNDPSSFVEITISNGTIAYLYGLAYDHNTDLLLAISTQGQMYELQGSDNWNGAAIVGVRTSAFVSPITITVQQGHPGIPYVLSNSNPGNGPYYIEILTYQVSAAPVFTGLSAVFIALISVLVIIF